MYRLRNLCHKDAERMLEWMHDAETMRYLRFDGNKKTIEDVYRFISDAQEETKEIHRAIVNEEDIYCGTVSLKNIRDSSAEFAIALHPDSVGKGIGSKAVWEMLSLGFSQYSLKRIYLNVLRINRRAIHVYEKIGFRYMYSTMISICGKNRDCDWYGLDKQEWKENSYA